MKIGKTIVSVACVALLPGCVQMTSVTDMAKDKPGYLATHFNVDSLSAGVRDKLPAPGTHVLPFKVLKLSGTMSGHVDSNDVKYEFNSTLTNANDTGVIQQVFEMSSNDVPSALQFSLSYLNLITLKQEMGSYSLRNAFLTLIAHDIDNVPFASDAPKENTTYTTALKSGTAVQLINFRSAVMSCHADHYYPASQINPMLTGKAIDLDCEDTVDGIVKDKARHTYLTEYGIGLKRSSATTTAKFEWTYSSFEKDGQKAPASAAKPANDKPA